MNIEKLDDSTIKVELNPKERPVVRSAADDRLKELAAVGNHDQTITKYMLSIGSVATKLLNTGRGGILRVPNEARIIRDVLVKYVEQTPEAITKLRGSVVERANHGAIADSMAAELEPHTTVNDAGPNPETPIAE